MLQLPKTDPIKLAKLEPILLRAKIDVPVITSFGVISERTSLLIRAEDTGGAVGWGEVFGNFRIKSLPPKRSTEKLPIDLI